MDEFNGMINLLSYLPEFVRIFVVQGLIVVALFSFVAKMLMQGSSKELMIQIFQGVRYLCKWINKVNLYLMEQASLPIKYPRVKRVFDYLFMFTFYCCSALFTILLIVFFAAFVNGSGSMKSIILFFVATYVTFYLIKFFFSQAEKVRLELKVKNI
ncbi:hypothetical protein BA1DRAFT_01940 [Photorhabdus aegyptia]|uniref:Uncharacterized protein n=2 Tax=Photorhabdus aegyptia TaxID=2805098 RepID=A0A022PHB5_9GAMM|nr:hypothetical protein BA1DRAFT_01940 [Photorhabdus aegyptia]